MTKKKIEPPLPPSSAQLIWFDPGSTTGVCLINADPAWLRGEGRGNLAGLKAAIYNAEHIQLGRYPRNTEDIASPTTYAGGYYDLAPFAGSSIRSGDVEELVSLVGGLDILARHPFAAWGYEDFTVRKIDATHSFLSPARVGSSLRDAMMLCSPPRIPFRQDPSDMVALPDERMQALGLYRRGMPHATDAARHAALFLRRARQSEELRAEAWPHLFTSQEDW